MLALALAIVAWFRSADDDLVVRKRATGAEIGRAFVIAIPALILPFLIRAAVVEGVATAVEVSTIGIAYTIVAGLFIYRQFDWRRVWPMLVDTAALSGSILFIVGTATAMAWALTQSGFSRQLALVMAQVPGGAAGFMALSIVVFVILGSVLEGVPALVLLAPLLFPIARQMGIHEVHYSMVVILAMGIGLFAPPFGVGFFTACAIGNVNPDDAVSRVWPYLGALLVGTIIVAAVPWLSTDRLRRLNQKTRANAWKASVVARLLNLSPALGGNGLRWLTGGARPLADLIADDEQLTEHVRHNVAGTFHVSGTARMGARDDPGAVVDPQGRVTASRACASPTRR